MFLELGCWVDYNNKIFKRNMYINLLTSGEDYFKGNDTGIFKTIYRYSSVNIKDSYFIGDFYLDFDCKDDFEKVREDVKTALAYISVVFKINSDCICIYFSGNKGIHVIIPYQYFSIKPSKDLNCVYKFIASNIKNYTKNKTVDLNVYDNKRLFRVPNSIHEKTNLHKVQLTDDEIREMPYDQILNLAKNKRTIHTNTHTEIAYSTARYNDLKQNYYDEVSSKNKLENIKHKQTLKITPPCIKYILEEGASDGVRNITVAVLSCFYKNKGVELNKTIDLLNKWNEEKNSPALTTEEVNRTIRSIYFGNYNYGCSTIKTLTKCYVNSCPMMKRGKNYVRK